MSYKKTYCIFWGGALNPPPPPGPPIFKTNYFGPPHLFYQYFRFKSLSPHISSSIYVISSCQYVISPKHFTYCYSPHPLPPLLLIPSLSHLYPPLPPSLTSSHRMSSCHDYMSVSYCHIHMSLCHTYIYKLNTTTFG